MGPKMRTARRARWSVAPVVLLLFMAAGSSAGAGVDRDGIERLLRGLETAAAARDADAFLSAYNPAARDLIDRTRSEVAGSFTLEGLAVRYRMTSLKGDSGSAEAVVLRSGGFTEHDRRQVDRRWETVGFRRTPSGWKIVSEEERDYQRCTDTRLQVELLPESGRMRGSSTLDVETTEPGEDSLLLLLNRGLEVRSVTDGRDRPLRFEREADALVIPLPRPLPPHARHTLKVEFDGSLFNESKEQGYSQVSIAPEGSFASWVTSWYPRLQGAGSRSRGRIVYTVPAGVTVASSGRLEERRAEGGLETQAFAVDHPLDFSFAAAKYFHREESVDGTRLGVYLLSGGDGKAGLYLREASRVLRCERSLYGAYPFDGYDVVEIPSEKTGALGGSSEQGMNLFPAGVLPDDSFPLLLLAHEMGHSWWGNLVRSKDGPILDEGLAQITAVLCLREFQGDAAMRRFLKAGVPGYRQSASQYFVRFAGTTGKDFPIGLPPAGSDAVSALHDLADTKGMFVYAMLRDRIGQDAFVSGLRAAAEKFAGRAATLADLQAAWEKSAGTTLDLFFRQWFRRTGAPDLALTSATEPAGRAFVTAGTVTQTGDSYDLPVEVALAGPGWREIRSLAVSGASTPFSFQTERRPDWVVIDPEYKILRWIPAYRHYPLLTDGLGLWSTGKRPEAIAKLQEYVDKVPESLEGRYRLGVCLEESGKLDEAERAFQWALDRYGALAVYEPAVSLSQLHLGQVLDLKGRRDEAKAAYDRALALPDEEESHGLARAGLASPFQPPAPKPGPGPDLLARFDGTYDNGSGVVISVALKDAGVLTVTQPGRPAGSLEWIDGARFHVAGAGDIVLEFLGEPEVTGLDLNVSGKVYHLAKAK
jgi:tetratricopeptide (TPR) repeat protein